MLKIGKGLKKKKKSKKGKKGEELFTEEELEQYKREHAHKSAEEAGTSDEAKPAANSEEFEKFKQLTAGVDDFLKKTQGDLDRIKKESFFQRKPTPSELKAQEEKEEAELKKTEGNWQDFEEGKNEEPEEKGEESHLEDSGSEWEVDEGDDIFDTGYVDAVESGEIKLAYVPDDEELGFGDGPDPFDTTTADELLRKAEEEELRKKKEIKLSLAVNVLTGRAERDRALLEEKNIKDVDEKISKTVRTRPRKIQDFCLLGSFDENQKVEGTDSVKENEHTGPASTLLDEDLAIEEELPEGEALVQVLLQQIARPPQQELPTPAEPEENSEESAPVVGVLEKLLINPEIKKLEEEEEFDEFSALAASSVINQKLEEELREFEVVEDDPFDTSVVDSVLHTEPDPFESVEIQTQNLPGVQVVPTVVDTTNWVELEEEEKDPFDTTFAENCAPGKVELRLLEREILEASVPVVKNPDILFEARILSRNNSEDFDPRKGEEKKNSRVSIQITDPSGETARRSESDEIVALSLSQRDLLGGSTNDLSAIPDEPLPPSTVSPSEELARYSDPFDTSIACVVTAPGKAELKFIEEELLSDLKATSDDEDFDPRAGDKSTKGVSFELPSPAGSDLLSSVKEEGGGRPLTPFYAEPASAESDIDLENEDPFDTSHVTHLPGKQELKLIEQELEQVPPSPSPFQPIRDLGVPISVGLRNSTSDDDFDPRAEEVACAKPVPLCQAQNSTLNTQSKAIPGEKPDLLVVEEELPVKTLTPALEEDISAYFDPFDTSIAENIAPGKAELKVLEIELVGSITDPDFNPRSPVYEPKLKTVISTKPILPVEVNPQTEEIDPFDTSIADNVGPGRAELRLLESELVGQ